MTPPLDVKVNAKNYDLYVVGDSTLNLYPNGRAVGGTLSHSHGWWQMKMKSTSGATLTTLVQDVRAMVTKMGEKPGPVNSMLIVVWNGNEFHGGPQYEKIDSNGISRWTIWMS
jgi:hypothetical protein